MTKYKVSFEWYASMRGYEEVEVEANSEEEARGLYWEKININYNNHTKIIDCDREINSIEAIK